MTNADQLMALADNIADVANGLRNIHLIRARQLDIIADQLRALARPEDGVAQRVCAEAYQVVGVLLSDTGQFDTERGQKILDNLSQARMVHDDVLPWPSTPPAPAGEDARDADTRRLDWLEANGMCQFYRTQYPEPERKWFDSETNGSDYAPTLRAAIDAALSATGTGGGHG